MATPLAALFPAYDMIHHCAGKLDGVQVGLVTAPGNVHGTHNVVILKGAELTSLPITSEANARAAYWELVSQFNAMSVGA